MADPTEFRVWEEHHKPADPDTVCVWTSEQAAICFVQDLARIGSATIGDVVKVCVQKGDGPVVRLECAIEPRVVVREAIR